MKKAFFIFIRLSLLSLMVLLGFTALFPGWFDNRHIITDEITSRFMSADDQILREKAQLKGVDFKEYKSKVLAQRVVAKQKSGLLAQLTKAQEDGDNTLLKKTLSVMQRDDVPSTIFAKAIENENLGALVAMSEVGFKCTLSGPTETLSKANDPRFDHGQWQTLRMFYQSNSPEVFAEWVALGCYQDQSQFIRNMLAKNKQSLFGGVPMNNNSAPFWKEVFWQSVLSKNEGYALSLIDAGVGQIKSSDEFALFEGPINSDKQADILLKSIDLKLAKVVEGILAVDKNYIRRNNISKHVLRALTSRGRILTIDTFTEGILDESVLKDEIPTYFAKAVEKGDVGMLRLLLSLDATLSLKSFDAANLANLDRTLSGAEVIHFPLLVENELKPNEFKYKGLDQLSQAMYLGDVALVDMILAMGVNPKKLYRGRSILDASMGGERRQQEQIKASLVNAGATQNLGALVRQETGVEYESSCLIGKRSVSSFQSSEYYQPIKKMMTERKKDSIDAYQVCELALLICTQNYKTGLDDCFESIPSCPQRVEDNGFHVKTIPSPICCPKVAKTRYNEMRCSGLDVISSSLMLRKMGFSESYSIPTFFLNTREYHEHSAKMDASKSNSPNDN
jgi:hypothetical protein